MHGWSHGWTWGAMAPQIYIFLILLYIWVLILVILFYKLHFCPNKNIIDYFKSVVIVINFSITFLQTVKVENSFWFAFGSITYIISKL